MYYTYVVNIYIYIAIAEVSAISCNDTLGIMCKPFFELIV